MWSLSAGVHHLNHGSFGAVPLEVQQAQSMWRARWEENPTKFVMSEMGPAVQVARDSLAEFLGAESEALAPVRNASQGVAAVVRSIEPLLGAGDEIVTTSQDYNAVRQTLEYAATRTGAKVRVVDVPFPLESPNVVTNAVLGSVGERCRLVVLDHITSPTGLIYPVERIVAELEPEVPVLVDGAHGPGQVPLRLDALGASWYTGNLHKWFCAPKGSAFLHTRTDRREMTVPTVISHGWNTPPGDRSRYLGLFDWTGTDDVTGWLVIPDVIRIVGGIDPGGWPALMKRNHEMVMGARDDICAALGIVAPAPDEMIGSMCAIPLPDHEGDDPGGIDSPLGRHLLEEGFETVVSIWPRWPHQLLRISAHAYNTPDEYRELAMRLSEQAG
ncbi:MAG: aminotransferase class V-fold PLP-dependent enzyme [Acidimicrobiia bacterium]